MKIDLVPGAIPYKSQVNPDQKDNIHDQIDEWLEKGFIKPPVSQWALPLIPVKKKDGWTRWVTDLRELNKQKVKDSYPLMNIQEILHSLQGATVFSSLDTCGAYHAVRIEPSSQECTAFISPYGTFQCIQMPFGLANTVSVYSRILDVAMKGVDRDFWISYLDDILTFIREPWAHFGHLAHVVWEKWPLESRYNPVRPKYLGHRISKYGVSMIPEYVQKIKDWPVPKSRKEVARFLGFAGY